MTIPQALPETSAFLTRTIDLAPNWVPQRPGRYLRISEDPDALFRGVDRQLQDSQMFGERLGWGAFTEESTYVENDTSAFKKKRVVLADGKVAYRVVRPVWDRMLEDLEAGIIDGIVVYDLDRLVRQPRDLEDLIDLVEQTKKPVQGVTGSIDLMTSNGRMAARMLVSVALKSSEDTSRRVARAAVADAEAGTLVRGGRRRYGWQHDGITRVPVEAAVIERMREMVMDGRSVGTVATTMRREGIPTVTGAPWTRPVVMQILRSPRLAGIRSYSGRFHEVRPSAHDWRLRAVRKDGAYVYGKWDTILLTEDWEALQIALDEHQENSGRIRRVDPGAYCRKYLLSGILRCGLCGGRMTGRNIRDIPTYCCRPKDMGGCNGVSRNAKKVDAAVLALVEDHFRSLDPPAITPAVVSSPEWPDLSPRREKLKRDWALEKISDRIYYESIQALDEAETARRREQLGAAEVGRRKVKLRDPKKLLAEVLTPHTPLPRRRAIIMDVLNHVTVMPSSRGPHFCLDDLVPDWR